MQPPKLQPLIFLSYSQLDADFARRLAGGLSSSLFQRGLKVDVITGQPQIVGTQWIEYISERILESDIVIFVLSPHSVKSNWASFELGLAVSARQDKPKPAILPVLWKPTDNIPTYLQELQYADFRDEKSFDTNLQKLAQTAYEILESARSLYNPEMAFDSKEGVAVPPTPNREYFSRLFLQAQRFQLEELQKNQERIELRYYKYGIIRAILASVLILLTTITLFGSAELLFSGSMPDGITKIRVLMEIILAPTIGLLGAAIGFYFGKDSAVPRNERGPGAENGQVFRSEDRS